MEPVYLVDSGSSTPDSWTKSHESALEDEKEIISESDHHSKDVEARVARGSVLSACLSGSMAETGL